MGIALSAILFALWQGRYCGLGTNLISAALNGDGKVAIMPWDRALKFALTIATLASGYQGGEVTPLFSIGASLGVVLAGILGMPSSSAPRWATPPSLAAPPTRCSRQSLSVARSSVSVICRRSSSSALWLTYSTWISPSTPCRSGRRSMSRQVVSTGNGVPL